MKRAKACANIIYSRHFNALPNNIITETWTAAPSRPHIKWLVQFATTRYYYAVLSSPHSSLIHFRVFFGPHTAFYPL